MYFECKKWLHKSDFSRNVKVQRYLGVIVSHGVLLSCHCHSLYVAGLTLVLVATIDAQWEGMGDVGSARYEPALLPPCPTIRVLSYSNW